MRLLAHKFFGQFGQFGLFGLVSRPISSLILMTFGRRDRNEMVISSKLLETAHGGSPLTQTAPDAARRYSSYRRSR